MANKFKNEMEITLAGEKILLRPTFDNLAEMESKIGGLPYLAHKYGSGISKDENGKIAVSAKSLPPMTETAIMIYTNQAERKYTQEQIFEMCLADGVQVSIHFLSFLGKCTMGNKMAVEPSEAEKKS